MSYSVRPKGRAALPLLDQLRLIDPEVQCERQFDWLFLPRAAEMSRAERAIAEALVTHCRTHKVDHPRKAACDCEAMLADARVKGVSRRLEFDFWLPSLGVAIEFDERQHFTKERLLTLTFYEGAHAFDVSRWQALCSGGAQDPDPPCRDWQRAFRDTIRDLRAREHGVPLLRIHHKDPLASDWDLRVRIDTARTLRSPRGVG